MSDAGAFSGDSEWPGLNLKMLAAALASSNGGIGISQFKQAYLSDGDPNGNIYVPNDENAVCFDAVNQVVWIKTDGLISNQGWKLIYMGSSGDGGIYTIPGDPLAPSLIFNDVEYGLVPYELSIDEGTQHLHWNFFSTFTPTPTDGGNPIFPVTALYLQRSPNMFNMPNGESAPVVSATLSEIATSLAQSGWTTIQQWGPVADLNTLPLEFIDTVEPDHIWNYRLLFILNPFNTFNPLNPGGGADDHRMEVDYNIASAVKKYIFTQAGSCNPPNQNQVCLAWH